MAGNELQHGLNLEKFKNKDLTYTIKNIPTWQKYQDPWLILGEKALWVLSQWELTLCILKTAFLVAKINNFVF